MKDPVEIINAFERVRDSVPRTIRKSGFKVEFILENIEMDKNSYYRRLKNPKLWGLNELRRLFEFLSYYKIE